MNWYPLLKWPCFVYGFVDCRSGHVFYGFVDFKEFKGNNSCITKAVPQNVRCTNIYGDTYTQENYKRYIYNLEFKVFIIKSWCWFLYSRLLVPQSTDIYPIFSARYSVMRKVYTGYHGTSEIEHGLCACTVDSPLAKARGISLRIDAQTMLYLSHISQGFHFCCLFSESFMSSLWLHMLRILIMRFWMLLHDFRAKVSMK